MRERVLLDDDFQMSAGESSSHRKFVIWFWLLHYYDTIFATVFIGEVLLGMVKEEDHFKLLPRAVENSMTPQAGSELW